MWKTTKLIEGGHRGLRDIRYYSLDFEKKRKKLFLRFFSKSKKSRLFYVFCRVSYVFSNYRRPIMCTNNADGLVSFIAKVAKQYGTNKRCELKADKQEVRSDSLRSCSASEMRRNSATSADKASQIYTCWRLESAITSAPGTDIAEATRRDATRRFNGRRRILLPFWSTFLILLFVKCGVEFYLHSSQHAPQTGLNVDNRVSGLDVLYEADCPVVQPFILSPTSIVQQPKF